ncbi:hypothetical protein SPRG_13850 [Saprolegnia parasitica CBS 223.65]|uniref:FYVE-type domain-containing protein n=1 Tax=Saprolegnia parasitica (strain CBS 223.65) TaxID=695850 RepID=A0A067C2M8_SAPPC|nr:hypothetical protein SPRG_13850 [Saprolegnia parasitica CBS 223.65]KDO21057.1 hypothetical protein SPRG_13850 [Saprolegnia parasitica CBS 223.65]|eukprot:XP_012208236.1 hypothetical protein SPRG_13850 [Saprolegnia parasitica CBS 223.65]
MEYEFSEVCRQWRERATSQLMRSSRKLERPASFAEAKPLQESERLFLKTIAAEAFEQFLSSAMERSPVWSLLGDFNHVTVYEGPALPSEDRIVPYRGSLSLNGSLDEVRAMLSNLTSDQMAFTQQHHNDGVLDMAILHHVVEPSLRDPFRHVVVRWLVLECPKPLSHRDFCVLETQKEWLLPGGRRAWAIAQHSVTLPTCPDLKSNLLVVRGSMYNSGLVFLESDVPGVLNVHSHMEINLKGAMPSWLYKSILKRHVSRIGYIASTIHEFRLAECVQSYFVVMVPLRDRTHCTQCLKRFHTLRRKWNCRTCGEVFCHKCTSSFEPKGQKPSATNASARSAPSLSASRARVRSGRTSLATSACTCPQATKACRRPTTTSRRCHIDNGNCASRKTTCAGS